VLAAAAFNLTGWSTVGLAVVTFLSVVLGYSALRQTQTEITLSRQEVQEAHRPVLVPILEERTLPSNSQGSQGEMAAIPTELNGVLRVPVANIGAGPALNIVLSINPTSDDGTMSPAWGTSEHDGANAGMGIGEAKFLIVPILRLAGVPSFRFRLAYDDVAGQNWETVGEFRQGTTGQPPRYGPLEFRMGRE
jgi:hypothetical protein